MGEYVDDTVGRDAIEEIRELIGIGRSDFPSERRITPEDKTPVLGVVKDISPTTVDDVSRAGLITDPIGPEIFTMTQLDLEYGPQPPARLAEQYPAFFEWINENPGKGVLIAIHDPTDNVGPVSVLVSIDNLRKMAAWVCDGEK